MRAQPRTPRKARGGAVHPCSAHACARPRVSGGATQRVVAAWAGNGEGKCGTAVVVGAGVIGLTAAIRLLEDGWEVKCVAKCTDGDPTKVVSGGAGGLWFPYLIGESKRTAKWANDTRRFFEQMYPDPGAGVRARDCWQCYVPGGEVPLWAEDCPSFRLMTKGEVQQRYGPHGCEYDIPDQDFLAYAFEAPVVEMGAFLSRMRRRLVDELGGTIEAREVSDLREVEADLVVNCGGIGNAPDVAGLCNDQDVKPIRGQILHVKNRSAVDECVTVTAEGLTAYVIPRGDTTVLGGTADEGQWELEPSDDVAREIVRKAQKLLPRQVTEGLDVEGHWAGLRPFRAAGVKVERETTEDGRVIIHNYGHGGSGITLCWGCADEVVHLASS